MNLPPLKSAQRFWRQLGSGSFRARFAGEALGLFAMKLMLTGLMFVVTVFFTVLVAQRLGIYPSVLGRRRARARAA